MSLLRHGNVEEETSEKNKQTKPLTAHSSAGERILPTDLKYYGPVVKVTFTVDKSFSISLS